MNAFRLTFVCSALAVSALAAAVPEMLIVQSTAIRLLPTPLQQVPTRNPRSQQPAREEQPPETPLSQIDVSNPIAQELYSAGRVSPIVWSLGDPIFRSAVNDGLIKSPSDNPNLVEVQGVQKKLKIELLLVVTAKRDGDQLKAICELYRGSKQIWRDEKSIGALLGGKFDRDGAVKSLARSWSEIMAQDPLKPYNPSPIHLTPDPDPGQAPKLPDVQAPIVPNQAIANTKLFSDAESYMKSSQYGVAISLLRDAVDAEPEDLDRRRYLVSALMRAGKPDLAAAEARRAGQVSANNVEMFMLAAKAWLAAGKPEEAQRDLNEVVARNPEGGLAREMLGEAALWQLNTTAAIEHFDAAMKSAPTPETSLYRALAKAITGDSEGSETDLIGAKALDPASDVGRYSFCVLVIGKAVNLGAEEIKSSFQTAVASPDKRVLEGVAIQNRRVTALASVLQHVDPPKTHAKSHERRLLALKLLAESLSDLSAYLETPTDDALTDARINLGEALKQLAAADEVYREEAKEHANGEQLG